MLGSLGIQEIVILLVVLLVLIGVVVACTTCVRLILNRLTRTRS
jgi:hypothetical protein